VWDRGKPKQLSIHGGVNLPKAVTAKSGDPAGEKKREDGAKASRHPEPLNLEQFKDTPVKGAAPILRLRSRDKIAPVLASPDFAAGIKKLALDAAAEAKAAVALSKFAVRSEFSSAATELVKTAGRWPEPSKFKSADDRQRAADALARMRPSWALPWLAQALVGTQARYTKLRHFLASRLILAAGGLMEAAEALGRDLLLDEQIIGLVTTSDPDAGAKLRADAAKLKLEKAVSSPGSVSEPPLHQVVVPLDQAAIMREVAWSDADEALGRALRDMAFMTRSFEQLESGRTRELRAFSPALARRRSPLPMTSATSCRLPKGFRTTSPARR
jgi:hypothetical protein